jgi:S-layer homology domain
MRTLGGLTLRMVALAATLGLASSPSPGEPVVASATAAPKFGTTNDATTVVSAYDFSPIDSTIHFDHPVYYQEILVSTTSPYGTFYAAPEIPRGALVSAMNVYYCNGNPPGGDDFLVVLEDTDPAGNFLGIVGSVTAHANDLCTSQSLDLTAQNYSVDSPAHRLLVWTIFGPNPPVDAIVAVGTVTISYRLQVSRAPLSPTFTDVPLTDSGYRYIEALAASGITAGCGGGQFCPDQGVTRRQMAVFLSRALGLSYRFGTVETTVQVPEWRFRPFDDTVQYEDTGPPQLARYIVSAAHSPVLATAVGLPPGAVLDQVAFDYCDDRPSGAAMNLVVIDSPLNLPLAQLSSSPGGCGSVEASGLNYTVGDAKLFSSVLFGAPYGDSQSRILGARFTYHLQVSPPPATATFADVPTSDPAFAHVEALAASGISGGCGGGNFCPTNPVTRRQMAVFLTKALGLSFN